MGVKLKWVGNQATIIYANNTVFITGSREERRRPCDMLIRIKFKWSEIMIE